MTFKMAFSREEVINQEEKTPGEQLMTLHTAGPGELGSGTLSQWSVDKMWGGRPEGPGKCDRTAGARESSWVLWPREKKSWGGKKLFSAL